MFIVEGEIEIFNLVSFQFVAEFKKSLKESKKV